MMSHFYQRKNNNKPFHDMTFKPSIFIINFINSFSLKFNDWTDAFDKEKNPIIFTEQLIYIFNFENEISENHKREKKQANQFNRIKKFGI